MKQWSKATIQLAVVMIAVGFVLMVLGWNGAAGLDTPEQQFPYLLSGTVPGLGLVLAGLTLAVIQEMRRTATMITSKLEELGDSLATQGGAAGPTVVPDDGSSVLAGRTTYHRPGCSLVAGRNDVQAMAPTTASERGLAPCRICDPVSEAG